MKAVLSNRIYLEVDQILAEKLKEELTYKIPSFHDPETPIVIRNYGVIRAGLMSLPIGRLDLIPSDYEIVDKRVLLPADYPEFGFPLRDSQQAVYDNLNDNAIINAKPSWGKTFAGLAIAGKLAQKTLVVVHTVPLRTQWAKEVKKVYGIDAGVIGSGKMNLNPPIVIGNVQSLYNCVDKIQKSFGTVILDEMHHVSSPTFYRVMDKMYSRYKIGLSGTLNRKDGKHVVFRDYFSNNIFKPPPENSMAPEVHVYSPGIHLPEDAGWALRVNALMNLQEYRNVVLAIADKYTRLGHNNLVVADRVEFLEYCASKREKGIAIVGNTENREEALESVGVTRNEVWGTTSIFKEGISHNILSALILATPINNEPMLEQLVGRVQRIVPGKLDPVVVDIRLEGHTGHNQFQQRLGHYMRMGYKVRYM